MGLCRSMRSMMVKKAQGRSITLFQIRIVWQYVERICEKITNTLNVPTVEVPLP